MNLLARNHSSQFSQPRSQPAFPQLCEAPHTVCARHLMGSHNLLVTSARTSYCVIKRQYWHCHPSVSVGRSLQYRASRGNTGFKYADSRPAARLPIGRVNRWFLPRTTEYCREGGQMGGSNKTRKSSLGRLHCASQQIAFASQAAQFARTRGAGCFVYLTRAPDLNSSPRLHFSRLYLRAVPPGGG
jgi:hypothetical protein